MFSISLIDYVGKIDNGIAVILSLMIGEKNYEIVYWFNPENEYRINIQYSFYEDFPTIKNLYDYKYLPDLIHHINTQILPPKSDIFKEFNV